MTAKIQQHVVPRRGVSSSSWRQPRLFAQRGSVTQYTMAVTAGLLLLLSLGAVGFLYLQQVLNTASQGSEMSTLEQKIMDLKEQERTIELQGAQLRSLETVQKKVEDLHLVNTQTVSYLARVPQTVATSQR